MKINLGDIMQAFGFINKKQLKAAVEQQKAQDRSKKLGEILVEQQAANPKEVKAALAAQVEINRALEAKGAEFGKVSTETALKVADFAVNRLKREAGADADFSGLTGIVNQAEKKK